MSSSGQVVALLVALATVVALAKVMGLLATRLAQPAVVGEIVAGVLVGPTLFDGAVADVVFPADIRPMLGSLANVGLVLFMFLVGLEFDRDLLRGRFGTVTVVSLGSMLTPFVLGVLLALTFADDRPGFVLYFGTAMAVTAFPVLARIVADWNLGGTRIGALALGSAALGDLLAWSMLAVAIATLGAGSPDQWRLLLAVPLVVVSFLVVRPVLARLAGRDLFAVVLVGLLGWSALTEWMGLHFIFGAFLFGLVMPQDKGFRTGLTSHVEHIGKVLLLPVYFVVAGLQVDLSELTLGGWGEFGLIVLVAIGGKFLGAVVCARLCWFGWRQATILGTLLNTRGLTELVILGIGLELGLLEQELYSRLVLMAIVTTMMTGPLLKLLYRRRRTEPQLPTVVVPPAHPAVEDETPDRSS